MDLEEIIFPWFKAIRKRILKSFPLVNEKTLHKLLDCVHEELQNMNWKDAYKAEILYDVLSYFYFRFSWKISWNKEHYLQSSCMQLLFYMTYIGLILSNGNVKSPWINKIFSALKFFPDTCNITCDILLLIRNIPSKYLYGYAAILRSILMNADIRYPVNAECFIKIMLLFRRLKSLIMIDKKIEEAEIYDLAFKVKCPIETINFLSTVNNNDECRFTEKNIIKTFLNKKLKSTFIKSLFEMLFKNKYDERIVNFSVKMKNKERLSNNSVNRNSQKVSNGMKNKLKLEMKKKKNSDKEKTNKMEVSKKTKKKKNSDKEKTNKMEVSKKTKKKKKKEKLHSSKEISESNDAVIPIAVVSDKDKTCFTEEQSKTSKISNHIDNQNLDRVQVQPKKLLNCDKTSPKKLKSKKRTFSTSSDSFADGPVNNACHSQRNKKSKINNVVGMENSLFKISKSQNVSFQNISTYQTVKKPSTNLISENQEKNNNEIINGGVRNTYSKNSLLSNGSENQHSFDKLVSKPKEDEFILSSSTDLYDRPFKQNSKPKQFENLNDAYNKNVAVVVDKKCTNDVSQNISTNSVNNNISSDAFNITNTAVNSSSEVISKPVPSSENVSADSNKLKKSSKSKKKETLQKHMKVYSKNEVCSVSVKDFADSNNEALESKNKDVNPTAYNGSNSELSISKHKTSKIVTRSSLTSEAANISPLKMHSNNMHHKKTVDSSSNKSPKLSNTGVTRSKAKSKDSENSKEKLKNDLINNKQQIFKQYLSKLSGDSNDESDNELNVSIDEAIKTLDDSIQSDISTNLPENFLSENTMFSRGKRNEFFLEEDKSSLPNHNPVSIENFDNLGKKELKKLNIVIEATSEVSSDSCYELKESNHNFEEDELNSDSSDDLNVPDHTVKSSLDSSMKTQSQNVHSSEIPNSPKLISNRCPDSAKQEQCDGQTNEDRCIHEEDSLPKVLTDKNNDVCETENKLSVNETSVKNLNHKACDDFDQNSNSSKSLSLSVPDHTVVESSLDPSVKTQSQNVHVSEISNFAKQEQCDAQTNKDSCINVEDSLSKVLTDKNNDMSESENRLSVNETSIKTLNQKVCNDFDQNSSSLNSLSSNVTKNCTKKINKRKRRKTKFSAYNKRKQRKSKPKISASSLNTADEQNILQEKTLEALKTSDQQNIKSNENVSPEIICGTLDKDANNFASLEISDSHHIFNKDAPAKEVGVILEDCSTPTVFPETEIDTKMDKNECSLSTELHPGDTKLSNFSKVNSMSLSTCLTEVENSNQLNNLNEKEIEATTNSVPSLLRDKNMRSKAHLIYSDCSSTPSSPIQFPAEQKSRTIISESDSDSVDDISVKNISKYSIGLKHTENKSTSSKFNSCSKKKPKKLVSESESDADKPDTSKDSESLLQQGVSKYRSNNKRSLNSTTSKSNSTISSRKDSLNSSEISLDDSQLTIDPKSFIQFSASESDETECSPESEMDDFIVPDKEFEEQSEEESRNSVSSSNSYYSSPKLKRKFSRILKNKLDTSDSENELSDVESSAINTQQTKSSSKRNKILSKSNCDNFNSRSYISPNNGHNSSHSKSSLADETQEVPSNKTIMHPNSNLSDGEITSKHRDQKLNTTVSLPLQKPYFLRKRKNCINKKDTNTAELESDKEVLANQNTKAYIANKRHSDKLTDEYPCKSKTVSAVHSRNKCSTPKKNLRSNKISLTVSDIDSDETCLLENTSTEKYIDLKINEKNDVLQQNLQISDDNVKILNNSCHSADVSSVPSKVCNLDTGFSSNTVQKRKTMARIVNNKKRNCSEFMNDKPNVTENKKQVQENAVQEFSSRSNANILKHIQPLSNIQNKTCGVSTHENGTFFYSSDCIPPSQIQKNVQKDLSFDSCECIPPTQIPKCDKKHSKSLILNYLKKSDNYQNEFKTFSNENNCSIINLSKNIVKENFLGVNRSINEDSQIELGNTDFDVSIKNTENTLQPDIQKSAQKIVEVCAEKSNHNIAGNINQPLKQCISSGVTKNKLENDQTLKYTRLLENDFSPESMKSIIDILSKTTQNISLQNETSCKDLLFSNTKNSDHFAASKKGASLTQEFLMDNLNEHLLNSVMDKLQYNSNPLISENFLNDIFIDNFDSFCEQSLLTYNDEHIKAPTLCNDNNPLPSKSKTSSLNTSTTVNQIKECFINPSDTIYDSQVLHSVPEINCDATSSNKTNFVNTDCSISVPQINSSNLDACIELIQNDELINSGLQSNNGSSLSLDQQLSQMGFEMIPEPKRSLTQNCITECNKTETVKCCPGSVVKSLSEQSTVPKKSENFLFMFDMDKKSYEVRVLPEASLCNMFNRPEVSHSESQTDVNDTCKNENISNITEKVNNHIPEEFVTVNGIKLSAASFCPVVNLGRKCDDVEFKSNNIRKYVFHSNRIRQKSEKVTKRSLRQRKKNSCNCPAC